MAINGFLPDYIPNRTWNCILNQIQNNSYCSSAKQHWCFSTQRRFWFILNKLSSVSPEHYIRITSFSFIINFTSYSCALGVCFYFVLVWGFLCVEVLFATCWMILIGCFLGYQPFKIYKLNTNQQITFIIFIFNNINSILVLFFKLSLKITLFTVIHKACIVPSQKWEKNVKKRILTN